MPGLKSSAFRSGSPNRRNLELDVPESLFSRGNVDSVTIVGSEEGERDVRAWEKELSASTVRRRLAP
jgi:hypothetical protein